jgi:replicative DNA helicase
MSRENKDGSVDLSDFVKLSGGKLDELFRLKQKPIDAVRTPLPAWNRMCRDFGGGIGLARGWHVTIGANTGNGKSVFALNMADEGTEHGENVGFVSLEMFWTQLTTRYMAIVSGEKIDALEPGKWLDESTHKRAAKAIDAREERTGGALWCNERHISSLDHITSAIEWLNEYKGCRMIIVDYMQLAKVIGVSDRLEAVTRISGEVRGIGADLRLVTIGLSQFNRETSKDRENPPTPQGLMGGSPLENDSDQVLLIDHTNYERNAMSNTAKQKFILGKNRHGPAGPISCEWDYSTLRIREVAPVYQSLSGVPERGEAWEPENAA